MYIWKIKNAFLIIWKQLSNMTGIIVSVLAEFVEIKTKEKRISLELNTWDCIAINSLRMRHGI